MMSDDEIEMHAERTVEQASALLVWTASRPTTAQVNVSTDLTALLGDSRAAMEDAISLIDLDRLHEMYASTAALIKLVHDYESWCEPALAHITESRRLLESIQKRSAAR